MIQNKNTKALINLLDDPDHSIYKVVKNELGKQNINIIPALEEKWENSIDEVCQERIENLIQYLHLKEIKKELKAWVKSNEPSLLQGFYIINKFLYPDLNFQKIKWKVDEIRKDVWLELNDSLTSLEKTAILNHIFFNIHGFSINHSNLKSPQNCFLNHILETKKGNLFSISMLYSIIARSLDLPIHFVDFPQNPLLAYFNRDIAIQAYGDNVDSDIIFYINPANKGSITGRKELEYHLKKMKYMSDPKYYNKGDDRLFILRLIASLQKSYETMGFEDKAEVIYELKTIISDHLGMNL